MIAEPVKLEPESRTELGMPQAELQNTIKTKINKGTPQDVVPGAMGEGDTSKRTNCNSLGHPMCLAIASVAATRVRH